jgi:hydrogenase maturation protease
MTLIIGVGNAFRRDDGAGSAVAEALRGRPGFEVLLLHGEGSELIEAWRGRDHVIVIDAMRSGAAVGSLRSFDALAEPLPSGAFPCLSHQFGLAEAVEMARLLDRLPAALTLWGIEGQDFGQGPGFSPEVAVAVAALIDRLGEVSD